MRGNRLLIISAARILLPLAFFLASAGCAPAVIAAAAQPSPALPAATRPPATPSPTRTPTAAPTSTFTPPPPSATPEPSPSPTPPDSHIIRGITGHKQFFEIGCEASTAKDWANFFGVDFSEFDFQYQLPISDNPEYGFVGSVDSPWGQVPPYGYGIYNKPVAELLNEYGLNAKAYKNYTLEQIKANIAADKPVIAWVIGNMVSSVPVEYTDSQGRKVPVASYEHVVIITGYTHTSVRYLNNGRFFEVPNNVFLNSWGVLDNMVIVLE